MFILPLVAVFATAGFGLKWRRLRYFAESNVALAKCAMGLFLLLLAILFLAT